MATTAKAYYDTLAPGDISAGLAPLITALDLTENCQQLAENGWTVSEQVAPADFNDRLRQTILNITGDHPGANMMLAKDPVFAEAVMRPKLLALAEFSVGRGFLLSQVAASVRKKGSATIGLHADNNWVPAPFPAHNMLMTACWACDGFTEEGGATLVIAGSNTLHRHPDADEITALKGAQAIECAAGSVAVWDGNLWHSNYPRSVAGERVVCHITYSRLMMRQVEDYRASAKDLISTHGDTMAQLMGRHDMLMSPGGADYSKLRSTFNNSKR